jgi:hypothetical protein
VLPDALLIDSGKATSGSTDGLFSLTDNCAAIARMRSIHRFAIAFWRMPSFDALLALLVCQMSDCLVRAVFLPWWTRFLDVAPAAGVACQATGMVGVLFLCGER